MIGLIFYGAIGFWLLVAFVLGYKIPQWLKLQPIWAWLFIPLVFFAPVIDEVIAIPQAYALCKQAEDAFWYDPTVKGGVLKYSSELLQSSQNTIGLNIEAKTFHSAHVLKSDGRAVIKFMEINFSSGLINTHLRAEFNQPMILPQSCPGSISATAKYQSVVKLLQLSREINPIFNQ